MWVDLGLWLCILFYLSHWGIGVIPGVRKSAPVEVLYMWTLRLGWGFHTLVLGLNFYTQIYWPQTLVSDLLNLVAWVSMNFLLFFNRHFKSVIHVAVLPLFSVFLLAISSSISSGHVPALELLSKQSWLYQAILGTHIITLIAGHLLFALACVLSLVFLYQENQIKKKSINVKNPIPSLHTLNRISYRSTVIGFIFLTIGLTLGILLNAGGQEMPQMNLRLGISLLVWLTYALFLAEQQIQGYQGKRVAIWPVIGFCILVIAVAVEVYHLNSSL